MKPGIYFLLLTLLTGGCASTTAVVPALDGAKREPINHQIPSTVPYLAPQTINTAGEQR